MYEIHSSVNLFQLAATFLCICIQITADINWGKAAVENVRMQCQIHLNRNLTLWVKDTGDSFPGLPDAITNSLCVAECAGFADACKNGKVAFPVYRRS